MRIGPLAPLDMLFNLLNVLIEEKLITSAQGDDILKKSLPPEWTDQQKIDFILSLHNPPQTNGTQPPTTT